MPVVFTGFFFVARYGHSISALWLSLASLFFYGWWAFEYVWLLLASVIFNYSLGYIIGHVQRPSSSKFYLIFAIIVNLALLCFYKYMNFFIDTSNSITGGGTPLLNIILPLGISFFTFTQIAFLVDVHRGLAREYKFLHYLLFVTYFPQLISGPVLHHTQMMPQFSEKKTYRIQLDNMTMGLSIFTMGLVKKVFLADNFSIYSAPIFAAAELGVQPDFIEAWSGALAYTLQLYFDFSGYCDMAIGVSLMFGIKLPINFNSPYKAASIIDFWRRWHMTLSKFLRDYLYIPMGGSKKGAIMRYVNIIITMLLGGLWHGASWTFVIWGGLHGGLLVANHIWRSFVAAYLPTKGCFSLFYSISATALTFLCVVIAWVFFRAESFSAAMLILNGCFGYGGISLPTSFLMFAEKFIYLEGLLTTVSFNGVFINIPALGSLGGIAPFIQLLSVGLIIIWFMPNSQQFFSYLEQKGKDINFLVWIIKWQPKPIVGFIFGCLFCLAISKLDKVSTFIYYQF